jgi:hypothetical protein
MDSNGPEILLHPTTLNIYFSYKISSTFLNGLEDEC